MLRTVLGFSLTIKSLVTAHKLQRQRPCLVISLSLVSDAVLASTIAPAVAAANGYPARTVTNYYLKPFT